MPQGLEVRDASGNVIFDSQTNASRIITTITTGTSNGSQTFPSVNNRILAWPTKYDSGLGVPPVVTVSGTTVSWSFGTAPADKRIGATIVILGY